VHRTLLSDVLR